MLNYRSRPINRTAPNAGQRARSISLPAPVKGWVTKKNLASMKADEAITLDNFFPREVDVYLRNGNSILATGVGTGAVESVMGYAAPAADKLLAAGGGQIYNVTGGTTTSLGTGFTSNRWQHTMFTITGSGTWMLLFNGNDTPQKYDGTTLTANVFTGIGDPTKLVDGTIFKYRLMCVEKDSLRFWYLPTVNSISGALSGFDLGAVFKLGGYLQTIATWTRDGGYGVDDYCVFISSKGEVAIYQGGDPGDANNWALVGVFRIGAPLGRRCTFKLASDVVVLTQDGILPMSRVIALDRTSLANEALSNNISPTVAEVAQLYQDTFGWQGMLYPRGRQLVVNVPVAGDTNVQWVMNTNTGAWCRFTGLMINCMGEYQDKVYFGDSSGRVWLYDDGTSDNNVPIVGQGKISFQYLGGNRNTSKKGSLVRPVFQADGTLTFAIKVDTDFRDTMFGTPVVSSGSGTQWDTAQWDTFQWGDSYTTFQQWRSVGAVGRCFSLKWQVSTATQKVGLLAVDWVWEEGGIL